MKRYFIHTFGCQMNVNDTLRMSEVLAGMSYAPSQTAEDADLIILNTCAIREKSEEKMLSALGRYRMLKTTRGAVLGVGGCVAQQEKNKLLEKVPYLDFVFGPDNIAKLPEILAKVTNEGERVLETAFLDTEGYVFPQPDASTSAGKITEFVTAMKGCDNVCAFCVVPQTRGREVSRGFSEILTEVNELTRVGVREVTLIGQNVNSYRGGISFAQLLRRVAQVPHLRRVRFTTSHPHDLSDELIEAFALEPKITPHFHLPVQCGSDRILKLMRRDYTVESYLERLAKLRQARPNLAVTTDIIVGFPGETEEEFQGTLRLTEQVRYEQQYSVLYSPRPRTTAWLKEPEWGMIPREVKVERLERLNLIQRQIGKEIMAAQVGKDVEVLVEGRSKFDPSKRFGRTPENRTVNFVGDALPGAVVTVSVASATTNQLMGIQRAVLEEPEVLPLPMQLPELARAEQSRGPDLRA